MSVHHIQSHLRIRINVSYIKSQIKVNIFGFQHLKAIYLRENVKIMNKRLKIFLFFYKLYQIEIH
ncbi:hypothetical protein DW083_07930 [Parabacteroides sp. AF48-14]|nr:hypothetical protein DW083_07930 [Parabacteroides sp. AF48-14]